MYRVRAAPLAKIAFSRRRLTKATFLVPDAPLAKTAFLARPAKAIGRTLCQRLLGGHSDLAQPASQSIGPALPIVWPEVLEPK
jgi:hypothetical protein